MMCVMIRWNNKLIFWEVRCLNILLCTVTGNSIRSQYHPHTLTHTFLSNESSEGVKCQRRAAVWVCMSWIWFLEGEKGILFTKHWVMSHSQSRTEGKWLILIMWTVPQEVGALQKIQTWKWGNLFPPIGEHLHDIPISFCWNKWSKFDTDWCAWGGVEVVWVPLGEEKHSSKVFFFLKEVFFKRIFQEVFFFLIWPKSLYTIHKFITGEPLKVLCRTLQHSVCLPEPL